MQIQLPVAQRVTETSVDWLTASFARGQPALAAEAHAAPIIGSERDRGNTLRPWSWQAYTGWMAGSAAFGVRPDGALLRLSGAVAGNHWRTFVPLLHNCSRVDLAVTVQLNGVGSENATRTYAEVRKHATERGSELSSSLIVNSAGGSTAYIGSRSSDKFVRVYDKYAESGEAQHAGCWRYELELKRMPAGRFVRWLAEQADEGEAIRATLGAYLADRGVTVPWPRSGSFYVPRAEPGRSDDERRLLWLHDQVRGVVTELLTRHQRATVMQALGLAQPGGLN